MTPTGAQALATIRAVAAPLSIVPSHHEKDRPMPAICPRPYAECQKLYHTELTRLADDAFRAYCRNILSELYLIGTMRRGNLGEGFYDLRVGTEENEGESIVTTQTVPRHLPIDALRDWFKAQLCRTPLWCFCD